MSLPQVDSVQSRSPIYSQIDANDKEGPCPFLNLIKKIWEFAVELFQSFLDLFKSTPDLNEREIDRFRELVRNLKKGGRTTYRPITQTSVAKTYDLETPVKGKGPGKGISSQLNALNLDEPKDPIKLLFSQMNIKEPIDIQRSRFKKKLNELLLYAPSNFSEELKDYIKDKKLVKSDVDIEKYIEPLVKWLESDRTASLYSFYQHNKSAIDLMGINAVDEKVVKTVFQASIAFLIEAAAEAKKLNPIIPPNIEENIVSKKLWNEAQRIAGMAAEVICEEKVSPYTKVIQGGIAEAPKYIQPMAKVGTIIGFEAFKPIYDAFAGVNVKEKINGEMNNTLGGLLQSLPEESKFADLLFDHIQENGLIDNVDKDKHIKPFCNWLLESNRSQSPSSFYQSKTDEELIKKVFKASIEILVASKVKEYLKLVTRSLGSKLSEHVQVMMSANFKTVTSEFVERVVQLLETMGTSTTIDGLSDTAYFHIEAMIKVDKEKRRIPIEVENRIKKAQAEVRAVGKLSEGVNASQELLDEVFQSGKVAYVEMKKNEATNDSAKQKAAIVIRADIEQKKEALKIEETEELNQFFGRISDEGVELFIKKEIKKGKTTNDAIFKLGEEAYIANQIENNVNEETARLKILEIALDKKAALYKEIVKRGIEAYIEKKCQEDPTIAIKTLLEEFAKEVVEEELAGYGPLTKDLFDDVANRQLNAKGIHPFVLNEIEKGKISQEAVFDLGAALYLDDKVAQNGDEELVKQEIEKIKLDSASQLYKDIMREGEVAYVITLCNVDQNEVVWNRIDKLGEDHYVKQEVEAAVELNSEVAGESAKLEIEELEKNLVNPNFRKFKEEVARLGKEELIRVEIEHAVEKVFEKDKFTHEVIQEFIKGTAPDTNSKKKDQVISNFIKTMIDALLPQQKIVLFEPMYEAVVGLHIDDLAQDFLNLAESIIASENASIEDSRGTFDNADQSIIMLKQKLFPLCTEHCQYQEKDVSASTQFDKHIEPLIEKINEKILKAKGENGENLNLENVKKIMKELLYPKIDKSELKFNTSKPTQKQIQIAVENEAKKHLIAQAGGETVDQITWIAHNMMIHSSFVQLIDESQKFAEDLISKNMSESLKNLIVPVFKQFAPLMQTGITNFIKGEIQNEITKKAKEQIDQYTKPEKLQTVLVSQGFPVLKSALLQTFAGSMIKQDIPFFAEHYKNLLEPKQTIAEKNKIYNAMSDKLLEMTKKSVNLAKEELDSMTQEEYRKLTKSLLKQLETIISLVISHEIDNFNAPVKVVERLLTAALDPQLNEKGNKKLGVLLFDAFTQLGDFKNIDSILNSANLVTLGLFDAKDYVVEMISGIAAEALYDYRQSPYIAMDAVVNSLSEKIPNKMKVKELLFEDDETEAKVENAQVNKEDEVKKIAALAYDFLMLKAEKVKFSTNQTINNMAVDASKKVVKMLLGEDTKKLENCIKSVAQKAIGPQFTMENFLFNCMEVVKKNVEKAADENFNRSLPTVLTCKPQLIPSVLYSGK